MKEQLLQLIANRFSVTIEEIFSCSRKGIINEARMALFLLSYQEITKNKTQLALWYNRKAHRSASNIIDSATDMYDGNPTFRRHVEFIREKLT